MLGEQNDSISSGSVPAIIHNEPILQSAPVFDDWSTGKPEQGIEPQLCVRQVSEHLRKPVPTTHVSTPLPYCPKTFTLIEIPGLGETSGEWLYIAWERPSPAYRLSVTRHITLLDQILASSNHGPQDELLQHHHSQVTPLETWHPALLDPVPTHARSF